MRFYCIWYKKVLEINFGRSFTPGRHVIDRYMHMYTVVQERHVSEGHNTATFCLYGERLFVESTRPRSALRLNVAV